MTQGVILFADVFLVVPYVTDNDQVACVENL